SETGKEAGVLRNEAYAHASNAIGAGAVNAPAVEVNLAARRFDPARDGLQQRRLADPVASKDANHLAGVRGQVDSLHDMARTVICGRVLGSKHSYPFVCPKESSC